MPYYQDCSCTIYHGNCHDILPHLEVVDLLLTDPPYGIKESAGKNKSRSNIAEAKDYGSHSWDNERIDKDLLCLALGVARYAVIFGGNYYTDLLSQNVCWFIWDKQNGNNDFADCELAWTSLPGAVRRVSWTWNGMIRKRPEDRFHPTQKPIEVMAWSILTADKKLKKRQETILDPFMGSGTTVRAAKDLGRKAIGIELEEQYCEISAKRLRQEALGI